MLNVYSQNVLLAGLRHPDYVLDGNQHWGVALPDGSINWLAYSKSGVWSGQTFPAGEESRELTWGEITTILHSAQTPVALCQHRDSVNEFSFTASANS